MLVTFTMKYVNFLPAGSVQSTVIIAGLVLSVIANFITGVWACVVLLAKPGRNVLRPQWLFLTNFCCFVFQIYLLLK